MDDDSDFNIDESIGQGRRSPMESGAARWTDGEAIPTEFDTNDASTFTRMKLIARLEQGAPAPVAMHVRASVDGSPFDFDAMACFPNLTIGPGAVLVVDYGDMSGRHRLVADLRSGTYRLPAVTFAQLYALQWNPAGQAIAMLAAGAFSKSPDSTPKLYTMTGAGTIAAGASAAVRVPYYAQYVDIWANGWSGGIGAPDAPILRAPEVGLYRDYTTGLFVPPWGPISLAGDLVTTEVLTIENAGPTDVKVFAQFHLEP